MKSEEPRVESKKINYFEKLLPLWVALCIIAGIILSQLIPEISEAINSLQIGGISIPIGICLFLMMYPAMLNLQFSELKKLGKNPKPIILTLISNWVVAPFSCNHPSKFKPLYGYGLNLGLDGKRKSRTKYN